ncbi:hypothetical protein AC1031_017718 [Aphanomyces cochlioides]|nr:hypothetical protein AC1031_017718 [Aphanomyces cochlioides]
MLSLYRLLQFLFALVAMLCFAGTYLTHHRDQSLSASALETSYAFNFAFLLSCVATIYSSVLFIFCERGEYGDFVPARGYLEILADTTLCLLLLVATVLLSKDEAFTLCRHKAHIQCERLGWTFTFTMVESLLFGLPVVITLIQACFAMRGEREKPERATKEVSLELPVLLTKPVATVA